VKVVLLHALPLDERMWGPQLAALEEFDTATPHLYRLGETMEAWADALLDEHQGELVLVGASMGGYCALAAARRAPDRIRGVLLTGSRVDADSAERRAGRADTIELIERDGAAGLWESMRPKLFPPDAPAQAVARAREIALEQDPEDLARAVRAIRDRMDSTATATGLGDALLVALGDRDPFVGLEDVSSFPHHVFPEAGHLPSLERPDEFNGVLRSFLRRWT
jgi:pimeloyl-ACP methyl ester carboxylesterase